MRTLKVVDLCCGAGLFSLGFKQAGMEIIYGADIWDKAAASFKANNPEADVEVVDVLKLTKIPKCDVFIGSPPCKGSSIQKRASLPEYQQAIEATKDIFEHFTKLLHKSGAKWWIWENTPLSAKFITLPHYILDAQDFGVPQRRKRVFFGNYPKPDITSKAKVIVPTITAWELCGGWKADKRGHRFSKFLNHKPTIDEMKYYMGIPKDYVICGTNQKELSFQIGNAVCPPVSKAIALKILEAEQQQKELEGILVV